MIRDILFREVKGENSYNVNFKIYCSANQNKYDYLIFVDSKGMAFSNKSKSWVDMISEELEKNNKSFLAIIRPKNLTVFFTIVNFLKSNNIEFNNLITNLGFVDLTPKKKSIINDLFDQNPFEIKLDKYFLEKYNDKNNREIDLYGIDFNDLLIDKLVDSIKPNFEKIFFINTIEFDKNIVIDRTRPNIFFEKLKETNILIRNISNKISSSKIININELIDNKSSNMYSYDAVHYTEIGHKIVYEKCKLEIKKF